MAIQRLVVEHLRNLTHVDITPGYGINWLIGPNASGKTSLLESIHVLGLGRSFRSATDSRSMVEDGYPAVTVFAELHSVHGQVSRVGVEKKPSSGTTVRINGSDGHSVAELARLLPVQLIDPMSHLLVSGSPGERRAFLDWGVFHVEQRFLDQWRRYRRVLSQRNALLRQQASSTQLEAWDAELAPLARFITQQRKDYLEDFSSHFIHYAANHFGLEGVELAFIPGWATDKDFEDQLLSQRDRDRRVGHTRIGPHRADLRITYHGYHASERVSRGQQKLIAAALKLAQADYFRSRSGDKCLLLVDDLPAELDSIHRMALFSALQVSQQQVFVTATELPDLDSARIPDCGSKVESSRAFFEVKNGSVTGLSML